MIRRSFAVGLVAALFVMPGCEDGERDRNLSTVERKELYGTPRIVGRLQDPQLTEMSGLAASARNPGKLWAHNDSGGGPVLYCMERKGTSCGTWDVAGAEALDWEDIAAAPGPDGASLYIADIGDNGRERESVTIYRVYEPHIAGQSSGSLVAEAFELSYPGGARDAEAVIVERTSGDLYVITKEYARRARVFVARAPLASASTFEPVARIDLAGPIAVVTGASLSPDDTRVVLSTYGSGYELQLPPGRPFHEIWEQQPVPIDLGSNSQGEAVAYLRSGDIVSGSEGARSPLYMVEYLARP